ncbi:DUF3068 domain-containing protein [Thermomonospora umbrina]|nr:DUF3068 domain-containing protein [Thermomonospora umbrina]
MSPRPTNTLVVTVLCALGGFALALAPLLRGYIADRLVVIPVNQYSKVTLVGENARYLDIGRMAMVEGASVVVTATVRGAPDSSNARTAVWDSFIVVEDAETGADLRVSLWRMAIDRKTGELRNCCGAAVDNDLTVPQYGLGPLWPLGDVHKRDYAIYDPGTRRTWPARFDGVERIDGVSTYRFVQHIKPTRAAEYTQLPGALLGLDDAKRYDAELTSEARVTVWVEPRSGVPVDTRQHVVSRLRTKDGVDRRTVAEFDLRMVERDRRAGVRTADEAGAKIVLVRTTGPLISLVVGLLLLGAGLSVVARRRGDHIATDLVPPPAIPTGAEAEGSDRRQDA